MENVFDKLHEEMKTIGAGVGHIRMNNVANDPDAIGVVSVYVDERPAHEVLDIFEQYLESEGKKDLLETIKTISNPKWKAPWMEEDES